LTAAFTKEIRHFANKICPQFSIIETPSEHAANLRAKARRIKKGKPNTDALTRGAKQTAKTFNIDTPKFHLIVHYPDAIAMYGTTDLYSTQMVHHFIISECPQSTPPLTSLQSQGEQEHWHMKRFYGRTNKNSFELQITRHEHRQARLRALNQIPHSMEHNVIPKDLLDKDDLPFTNPEEHHHMSQSKSLALNLFKWVQVNHGDSAVKVCPTLLPSHFKSINM
jgi:hypothetical protein